MTGRKRRKLARLGWRRYYEALRYPGPDPSAWAGECGPGCRFCDAEPPPRGPREREPAIMQATLRVPVFAADGTVGEAEEVETFYGQPRYWYRREKAGAARYNRAAARIGRADFEEGRRLDRIAAAERAAFLRYAEITPSLSPLDCP